MGLESYNEVPDLETDFASDEQVEDYRVKNEAIDTRLADIKSQLDALHRTDEISPAIDASELEHLLDTWDAAQQEKVHVSANYPGDWTLLLRDRVLDEATKTAFIAQRTAAMEHMKAGEPQTQEIGNKYGKRYATHYQNQIDAYDERVATIFASTNIENASAAHKHQLGFGAINDGGTIYSNAESRKTGPLTSRQKNIIEAHEKGHGLRDFESPTDTAEIRSVIDTKALETLMLARKEDSGEERFRPGYVLAPEEIIERMAQFKNYFGMSATETFTKKHLDYVRTHYVSDTGLDNSISDLLHCVTPETEAAFLSVINKYPI